MNTFLAKYKLIIAGLVVLLLLFFVNKYNYNRFLAEKAKAAILENNFKAAQDTIRIFKTKDSTFSYEKLSYIVAEINDLKNVNKELYKEIKNLKGDIKAIQKAEVVVVHDTVPLLTEAKLIDSTLYMNSKFDTSYSSGNYRSLAFLNKYDLRTGFASGTILKDEIGFTAVTGIKKTEKGYEIFVNPKYPNMKVVNLEGAIVSNSLFVENKNKPKLVTIGVSLNWVPITYDIGTKALDINTDRIGLGAGLNFNLGRILGK